MRARAFAVQAEIAAQRKLARPTSAGLARAEHYTAKATPHDPSGSPFTAVRLAGFTGLYHLLTDSSSRIVLTPKMSRNCMPGRTRAGA